MNKYNDMTMAERTAKLPNGSKLVECGFELVGVGMHRDSHPYEESNFMVASGMLDADGDIGRPWEYGEDEYPIVGVAHFRHWAVGWVDELVYRPGVDPDTDALVLEIREALDRYPLLDEGHASELEWDANHPEDGVCYAEDYDDCPCQYG